MDWETLTPFFSFFCGHLTCLASRGETERIVRLCLFVSQLSFVKVNNMAKYCSLLPPFALQASLLVALGSTASAQNIAQIDSELAGGIDFRGPAFSTCLGQTECSVDGVTIVGQRRLSQVSDWLSAPIYWDPIDGLGIEDGAQNDEIDIDERLLVQFETALSLDRIWLSDLFISEDRRYGASGTDLVANQPADAEIAAITFAIDGADILALTVAGESRLPWAQFNQEVDIRFSEDGDLRRRIVVNEDVMTVVVPGADIVLQTPTGESPEAKQGLFEGLDTVELDLTTLLAEFNDAPLFEQGTANFEIVRSIAEDPDNLAEIIRIAQDKRTSIQMSNGEVGISIDPAMRFDEIAFSAPFDASNDFSVAGIVQIQ